MGELFPAPGKGIAQIPNPVDGARGQFAVGNRLPCESFKGSVSSAAPLAGQGSTSAKNGQVLENGLHNTARSEGEFWIDIKSPDLYHEDPETDFDSDEHNEVSEEGYGSDGGSGARGHPNRSKCCQEMHSSAAQRNLS